MNSVELESEHRMGGAGPLDGLVIWTQLVSACLVWTIGLNRVVSYWHAQGSSCDACGETVVCIYFENLLASLRTHL